MILGEQSAAEMEQFEAASAHLASPHRWWVSWFNPVGSGSPASAQGIRAPPFCLGAGSAGKAVKELALQTHTHLIFCMRPHHFASPSAGRGEGSTFWICRRGRSCPSLLLCCPTDGSVTLPFLLLKDHHPSPSLHSAMTKRHSVAA